MGLCGGTIIRFEGGSVSTIFHHALPQESDRCSLLDSGFSSASSPNSLQFRLEFYNLLNHSNLYINGESTDIFSTIFSKALGQSTPGVTASCKDSRQIVLALRYRLLKTHSCNGKQLPTWSFDFDHALLLGVYDCQQSGGMCEWLKQAVLKSAQKIVP